MLIYLPYNYTMYIVLKLPKISELWRNSFTNACTENENLNYVGLLQGGFLEFDQ